MPRLEKMDEHADGDPRPGYLGGNERNFAEDMDYEYELPHGASAGYYAYKPSIHEVYVNIKQYKAIKMRKARRDYLDTLMEIHRSSYLHESRHRHAMNRLRAPSGRFLTKEEMAEVRRGAHGDGRRPQE